MTPLLSRTPAGCSAHPANMLIQRAESRRTVTLNIPISRYGAITHCAQTDVGFPLRVLASFSLVSHTPDKSTNPSNTQPHFMSCLCLFYSIAFVSLFFLYVSLTLPFALSYACSLSLERPPPPPLPQTHWELSIWAVWWYYNIHRALT